MILVTWVGDFSDRWSWGIFCPLWRPLSTDITFKSMGFRWALYIVCMWSFWYQCSICGLAGLVFCGTTALILLLWRVWSG